MDHVILNAITTMNFTGLLKLQDLAKLQCPDQLQDTNSSKKFRGMRTICQDILLFIIWLSLKTSLEFLKVGKLISENVTLKVMGSL